MGSPPPPASTEKVGRRKSRRSNRSMAIIFRYADRVDVLLMVLGTIGAIGDGMSTNILLLFASRIMNSLGYGNSRQSSGGNSFMAEVEKVSMLLYH